MRLHKEGIIPILFFLIFFSCCIGAAWWSGLNWLFWITCWISFSLMATVINFFRNPKRHFHSNDDPYAIVAPADGTIVVIETVDEQTYCQEKRIQISIFMSIFNVHANWYPLNGKVIHSSHHPGRYLSAFLPKASTENEHSDIVIESQSSVKILTRQIAGALARRIITYAKPSEECHIDQHMGFIRFGSRVDVFVPVDSEILVKMDETTMGNQTVIARLKPKNTPTDE